MMINDGQSALTPLEYEFQHLQGWLSRCGYRQLGNLFSNEPTQVTKTIQAIRDILHQRDKDKEKIAMLSGENNRKHSEILSLDAKMDKQVEEIRKAHLERDALNVKLNNMQRAMKEANGRWQAEKEMMQKVERGLLSKEVQYQKELKRQQLTLHFMNDKLAKLQDKVVFKNSIEHINKFIGLPQVPPKQMQEINPQAALGRQNQALRAESAWFRSCLKVIAQRLINMIDKVGEMTTFKVQTILGPQNELILRQFMEIINCIENKLTPPRQEIIVNLNACASCNETANMVSRHKKLVDEIIEAFKPFLDLSLQVKKHQLDKLSLPQLPNIPKPQQPESFSHLNKIREIVQRTKERKQEFKNVVGQMQSLIKQLKLE